MGLKQGSNMTSFVLQKDRPVYCVNKKMGRRERWECRAGGPEQHLFNEFAQGPPSEKAKLD